MSRMVMGKNISAQVLTLFFLFALALPCYGGVIFEDNFDAHPDWNTAGQYEGNECSPLGVGAPSENICASNTYPPNWSAYRSVPGTSGLSPVASIGRPPDNADHTTGTGKAAIIRQESVNGVNFPGDGFIQKYLGAEYNELYIQFWFKAQKGWQFDPSGDGYFKMFRVSRKYNLASNWFDLFTPGVRPSPGYITDPKHSNTYGWRHTDNLRGYPDDGGTIWYGVCTDTSQYNGRTVCNYGLDAIEDPYDYSNPNISWSAPGQLLDGTWHRMSYRLKMNDVGVANGILQWWMDGILKTNATRLTWIGSSGNAVGFNMFAIGGNSNNTFSPSTPAEQWYAIDDVVVSTTPIPDDYVPGGGTHDTTAPSAPTRLRLR